MDSLSPHIEHRVAQLHREADVRRLAASLPSSHDASEPRPRGRRALAIAMAFLALATAISASGAYLVAAGTSPEPGMPTRRGPREQVKPRSLSRRPVVGSGCTDEPKRITARHDVDRPSPTAIDVVRSFPRRRLSRPPGDQPRPTASQRSRAKMRRPSHLARIRMASVTRPGGAASDFPVADDAARERGRLRASEAKIAGQVVEFQLARQRAELVMPEVVEPLSTRERRGPRVARHRPHGR